MPPGIYKRTKKHLQEVMSHLPKSPQFWKGKRFSDEHKKKLSLNHRGMFGRKHSVEARKKMSLRHKGSKSYLWKGGVSPINRRIRRSFEYRLWREAVFARDGWTCVWCGQVGGRLNADHIKRFSDYPELRFALDNGRTLCEPCHKTTDTFGYKRKKVIQ